VTFEDGTRREKGLVEM